MSANLPTSYPLFEKGHLLQAKDLNNLFDYLDGQIRVSRRQLIGTGVICGLQLIQTKDDTGNDCITITAGLGLSSDGYILHLPKDCTFKNYTNDGILTNGRGNPISNDDVCDKIVRLKVVFNDLGADSGQKCIGIRDTDTPQKEIEIQACLVSNDEAVNPTTENTGGAWQQIPPIKIPRFAWDAVENTFDLCIEDTPTFWEKYKSLCGNFADEIITAFDENLSKLEEILLNETNIEVDNWLSAFKALLNDNNNLFHLQYYYDYLKDIATAYNELIDGACDLSEEIDCNINITPHPNYVDLGWACVNENDRSVKDHRHQFLPSVALASGDNSLEEVTFLYERLFALTQSTVNETANARFYSLTNFFISSDPKTETHITASKGKHYPLGERPIPFYYRGNSIVRTYWNYKAWKKDQPDGNTFSSRIPRYDETTLQYSIDNKNFFRIEGHVGHSIGEAINQIGGKLRQYNLPFDLIGLKIGESADGNIHIEHCNFEDLEIAFLTLCKELECLLQVLIDCLSNSSTNQTIFGDEITNLTALKTRVEEYIQAVEKDNIPFATTITFDNSISGVLEDIAAKILENQLRTVCEIPRQKLQNTYFDARFKAIRDSYLSRLAELRKELSFKNFAIKNYGMEHLAGVTKGGTFILVYAVENTDTILDILEGNSIDSSILRRIINSRGAVIGDFALPYRYNSCASCIPVSIVNTPPFIYMANREFCQGDEREEILVYPLGGSFSINRESSGKLIVREDGCWFFDPVEAGEFQIVYDLNGQQVTLKATVKARAMPMLTQLLRTKQCTISSNPTKITFDSVFVRFRNDSTPADAGLEFKWWINNLGKIDVKIGEEFGIAFPTSQNEHTVFLEVIGDVCGVNGPLEIPITLVETRTLELPMDSICQNESVQLENVRPIGGTFILKDVDGNDLGIPEENFIQVEITGDTATDECPNPDQVTYTLVANQLEPSDYILCYEVAGERVEVPFNVKEAPEAVTFDKPIASEPDVNDDGVPTEFKLKISNIYPPYDENTHEITTAPDIKLDFIVERIQVVEETVIGEGGEALVIETLVIPVNYNLDLVVPGRDITIRVIISVCDVTGEDAFIYPEPPTPEPESPNDGENGDTPIILATARNYSTELDSLDNINTTRTFQTAKEALGSTDLEIFKTTASKTLLAIRDNAKRPLYEKLLYISLASFLDAQVQANPDSIPVEVETELTSLVQRMNNKKISLENFLNFWKGETLKAVVVADYKKLFK